MKLLASCSAMNCGVNGSMFGCKLAELLALCSCGAGGIIGSVLCMNCGVCASLFTDDLLRIHTHWVAMRTEVLPLTWADPSVDCCSLELCTQSASAFAERVFPPRLQCTVVD